MAKKPATGKRVYYTSDARADFGNKSIIALAHRFSSGDVRAVSIITVWADGEVGAEFHIETEAEKTKMIANYERMLRILKGEEVPPSPTS